MLHCVVPHVGDFRAQYPEITLELTSNDRIVDLMEHRTDVALRMGPLTDSTLHARPLRPSPRWMMASPDYIARRGAPETVEDLAGHEVLGFTHPESLNVWPLRHAGGSSYVATPTLATSSGETQRQLALRGVGIACLSDFVVREDIAAGRLVKVMEGVYSDYLQPMHAVYHRNTQLSRRIACFLDFYAGRI
jgi:DNA-binding transcriptional LysR family regulator